MEAPVAELLPIVKESSSVHAVETSHNRDGKNHWMWGFIAKRAALFSIHASRGKKVLWATEYVARSASLNVTCKLQKKSPFNCLCTLLQNHFSGISTSALALIA